MIAPGLFTLLTSDVTISGLIGTRMYPVRAPQNKPFPLVTYTPITGTRFHHSEGGAGLSGPRIQIDCWGESYADAKNTADAIRKVLDGYSGAAGDETIQGAFFDSERDSFEPDAGVEGVYRVSHDYFIYFEESETPA